MAAHPATEAARARSHAQDRAAAGPTVGGRPLRRIVHALAEPRHWAAMARMPFVVEGFPRPMLDYLLATGRYPRTLQLRTPAGAMAVKLHSHHDLLTVNEIFCRGDYACQAPLRTVVDVGANIGLAAVYFATRDPDCRVYAYEPLSLNLTRLIENTAPVAGQVRPVAAAVGLSSGTVRFGIEPTGRYGGIGLDLDQSVTVECREINGELRRILAEREWIDVLKLDVEGLERDLVRALAPDVRDRIGIVMAECTGASIDLPGFSFRQRGPIATYRQQAETPIQG